MFLWLDGSVDRFIGSHTFCIEQLVEGRVVYAHKLILSALSERFRGMFSSGFREARESQITVPDVRYEVFVLLLGISTPGTSKHTMMPLLCFRQHKQWIAS